MISQSASPNQPKALKPLFSIQDYPGREGLSFSAQIDIRDFARYYAEDARASGGYETDWSSGGGSPYIKQKIHDAEDAMRAVSGFQFPEAVRHSAKRHARSLAQVFAEVVQKITLRDQVTGRLDRHKLSDIAMHSMAGTYDTQRVRPFRRNIQAPIKPPTIAIVASAGNAEMWDDEKYIPRVMELTLALSWATEAAGLRTYAALMQGHCEINYGKYKQAHLGIMLAQPGVRVSPSVYAAGLHRDLWRYGLMTSAAADFAGSSKMCQLRFGSGMTASRVGRTFPCYTGGDGVTWAREILKADIVIGIGNLADVDRAEIQLGRKFGLDEAVKAVIQQAKSIKKER